MYDPFCKIIYKDLIHIYHGYVCTLNNLQTVTPSVTQKNDVLAPIRKDAKKRRYGSNYGFVDAKAPAPSIHAS